MPSENLIKYRVWCTTDAQHEETDYRLESDGVPTSCPVDPVGHAIDPTQTRVLDILPPEGTFDGDGNLKIIPEPRGGAEKYFYLPNLCDPSSWYEEAVPVVEQSYSSGDGITWTNDANHVDLIDLRHGRVFKEDQLPTQATYDMLVEVSTDGGVIWNPAVENTWGQTDNDYTVDYPSGDIVFNADQTGNLVRASYHRATTSKYTVRPSAGKRIKLLYVEVQYTADLVMDANFLFTIFGNVEVFAPQLWDGFTPPGPLPAGTPIPLVAEIYKRMDHFFQESTGPYPVMPAHGGTWEVAQHDGAAAIQAARNAGWTILGVHYTGAQWIALMERHVGERAMRSALFTIPFKYLAYRDLRDSAGLHMEVQIEGDQAPAGQFANVTFYCLSEDE